MKVTVNVDVLALLSVANECKAELQSLVRARKDALEQLNHAILERYSITDVFKDYVEALRNEHWYMNSSRTIAGVVQE